MVETKQPVTVIGAGLAGCEAAWQLARRGIPVTLREMKPQKMTPAHHSPGFAELVSDSELYLMFSNGFTAKFEFRGSVDIGALGRTISTYVL